MKIERLTFEQVYDIWNNKLWPDRKSPIESHSAMTWPFEGDPEPIDMSISLIMILRFGVCLKIIN